MPILSFLRRQKTKIENALYRRAIRKFLNENPKGLESACGSVLIWDLGNFESIIRRNGHFATALRARSAKAQIVICDGAPVACIQRGIEQSEKFEDWERRCAGCAKIAQAAAEKHDLSISWVSDYVPSEKLAEFRKTSESCSMREIYDYQFLDTPVGQLAWSSFNRYMKGYLVELEQLSGEQQRIFRKYFFASLVNTYAAFAAVKRHEPTSILTSHGVYVEYAPILSAALQSGIPAMSWASGYSAGHHFFTLPKSKDQLVLQGITRASWEERAAKPLTPEEEDALDAFFHRRYFKKMARDITIFTAPERAEELKKQFGIRNDNPTFVLFAHVNWDSCFDMNSMIFPTANAWVVESIKRFIEIKDVNWIVRIHPGEINDGSVYSTGDLIREHFKTLPGHVHVLWAESEINSYGLFQMIDGGITILGTVGVELAMLGKPVIIAGEAHYGRKGFTYDSNSIEEYFQWIGKARSLPGLSEEKKALARRYAYNYLIQRHLPLRNLGSPEDHWSDFDLAKMDQLRAGQDPVWDLICASVLSGKDAILPSRP
jgi:hypothetical protein